MEFRYRAITAQGERVTGVHKALTSASARKELNSRFASVLEVEEISASERSRINRPFKAPAQSVAIFFRQMSTMLNSGVALADALNFVVISESNSSLGKATDYLTRKVTGGMTLSSSMADPRLRLLFDRVSIGMVALGEQTGQLAKIMEKLADLKERQLNLNRSLISALTYPAVLFCVIVLMALLFTLVLGPGEDGLFAAFGTEIPWPTQVVQTVSGIVRKPWILLGAAALLAFLAWAFRQHMRTSPAFRLRVHVAVLALPVIGPLLHKIECAKILYVLSDGMDVGIPAVQVLAMARDVCANEKVKIELNGVLRAFSDGSELNEALSLYPLFPRMVLSMVEIGMESGQLDKVLHQASLGFEEDVQMTLDNVTRLAEPMLLSFAGLMAGFLAIATLLPIIKMVQNI